MLLGETHILVHVERDDVLERHFARLVAADQFLVGLQRVEPVGSPSTKGDEVCCSLFLIWAMM